MKLIPSEKIELHTKLSIKEVILRLKENVEPKRLRFVLHKRKTKRFEGFVYKNGFEISRIIRYQNSFLPIIHGKIRLGRNKTIIDVMLKLHLAVKIFLIAWCSLVAVFFIFMLMSMINNDNLSAWILLPLWFLLFAYILSHTAFAPEITKAKDDLCEILEARDKSN